MIKHLSYFKAFGLILLTAALLMVSCANSPNVRKSVPTVAIWNLDDLSPTVFNQPDLGELLSNQIISFVQETGEYSVIEREQLLLALEELHLGTTSMVDETTRLKLGKISGAQLMVFGGYQVIGKTMRLDLRLVEVETGRVKKAVQETTSALDISGWLDSARAAAQELL
jgi:curli biogenesis system outer membrane secretion channel CsgG